MDRKNAWTCFLPPALQPDLLENTWRYLALETQYQLLLNALPDEQMKLSKTANDVFKRAARDKAVTLLRRGAAAVESGQPADAASEDRMSYQHALELFQTHVQRRCDIYVVRYDILSPHTTC